MNRLLNVTLKTLYTIFWTIWHFLSEVNEWDVHLKKVWVQGIMSSWWKLKECSLRDTSDGYQKVPMHKQSMVGWHACSPYLPACSSFGRLLSGFMDFKGVIGEEFAPGDLRKMALPLTLELVSTLGSHCVRRSVEQLQQVGATWQQVVQPLPLGFPPGPEGDVAFELAQEPLQCLESLQSRYGGLVGFKLASRPIVLVSSPSVLLHTPMCFLHHLLQTSVGAVRLQLLGNGIWEHTQSSSWNLL